MEQRGRRFLPRRRRSLHLRRQQSARAEAEADTATEATSKRRKKDLKPVAAESKGKAGQQEEKTQRAQHKKTWEDWQQDNDAGGKLLDSEPAREESITQTDSQKKYGLKPSELGSLLHFEKSNPLYGNTMKLFLDEDVKKLAFRKYGTLAGETKESEILDKGEKLWTEEHKDDTPPASPSKTPEKESKPAKTKAKTPKQKWSDYVSSHAIAESDMLSAEPEEAVNQTDSKTKYNLTPQDLACLPYFPKPNHMYKNTTKLFEEGEVSSFAYRKQAVLAGVEEDDEVALLKRGKELFEEKEQAA